MPFGANPYLVQYGPGATGLGDVASIGEGFLSGAQTGISNYERFMNTLAAKEYREGLIADRQQGRRVKAIELARQGIGPDVIKSVYGGADLPGLDTISQQAQGARTAVNQFRTTGDLDALNKASGDNPFVAELVKGDPTVSKAIEGAVDRRQYLRELPQYEADVKALTAAGTDPARAMGAALAKYPTVMKYTGARFTNIQGPETPPVVSLEEKARKDIQDTFDSASRGEMDWPTAFQRVSTMRGGDKVLTNQPLLQEMLSASKAGGQMVGKAVAGRTPMSDAVAVMGGQVPDVPTAPALPGRPVPAPAAPVPSAPTSAPTLDTTLSGLKTQAPKIAARAYANDPQKQQDFAAYLNARVDGMTSAIQGLSPADANAFLADESARLKQDVATYFPEAANETKRGWTLFNPQGVAGNRPALPGRSVAPSVPRGPVFAPGETVGDVLAGQQTPKTLAEWRALAADPNQPPAARQRAQKIADAIQKGEVDIAGAKAAARENPPGMALPTTGGPVSLDQIPADARNIVDQLVHYKIPLPSGFALRSPFWQRILSYAGQVDPSFDATQYNVRLRARQDFTSGKSANNIRSLNTAIGHLETLQQKALALSNSPYQLWNEIANRGITAVGDPRVVEFNNAANAVETEAANVFKNMGATDQEIKAWRTNLNASMSPEQLTGSIGTITELLGSRMEALHSQYQMAMGKPADYRFLAPKSRAILRRLGVNPDAWDPAAGQAPPATAAPRAPQPGAPGGKTPQQEADDYLKAGAR